MSPGGSVSRWFGFTPLVDEEVVCEPEPAAGAEDVCELDVPPAAALELDDEPQPAITIEVATAISAWSLRIEPPDVVGLIAADRRRPRVTGGFSKVNARSKLSLALPSAHGRPSDPDRRRRRGHRWRPRPGSRGTGLFRAPAPIGVGSCPRRRAAGRACHPGPRVARRRRAGGVPEAAERPAPSSRS